MNKFSYNFLLLHVDTKFYLAFVLFNHERKALIPKYVLILPLAKQDLFCKGIQFLPIVAGLAANSTCVCYTVTPQKGRSVLIMYRDILSRQILLAPLSWHESRQSWVLHSTGRTHRETFF